MWRRRLLTLAASAAIGLGAATAQAAEEIVVGGKNFTEQLILAEMTTRYLENKGYEVDKRDGMGSTVLRRAQLNGQVDLYWEYVGTSLLVYNKVEGGAQMSPKEAYKKVKQLDAEKGLVWLQPSGANNTYALAMEKEEAEQQGIEAISDLVQALKDGKELEFATNAEFTGRPDGLPGLEKHYGFDYPPGLIKRMDTGLTYSALKEDQVDVALVFATDGRIAAFDFKVLEDDENFFPNYALTPVVRQETLDAHPELGTHLNQLSGKLDDATMQRLNKRVDVNKETVEQVAQSFLNQQGLI